MLTTKPKAVFRLIVVLSLAVLSLSACQNSGLQEKIDEAKTVTETATNPNSPTENEVEAAKNPCDEAKTPEEAETCAKTEFDQTNAELNRVYGAIMKDFQDKISGDAAKNDKKLLESLKKNIEDLKSSQEKWLSFRDADCDAEKNTAEPNENPNYINLNCRQRLSEQRIDDLKLIYNK